MPVYKRDKELKNLGDKIIEDCRPNLKMLEIAYLFRAEAPISDNKVTAGMCVRVDDRNRTIHGVDFVIEISQDVWLEANDQFKLALMDHELGHVGIRMDADGQPEMDEKTMRIKTYIKKHDIEEFEDVLERHGDYHKELRSFLEAFARHKKKKKDEEEGPDDAEG